MRRLLRFVASLYPRSWRQRYGAEFAALLEDVNPDWRTSMDILNGALMMQMNTWNFGKIFLAAGVAGALIAAGISFAIPRQYASQTVLHVAGPADSAGATDAVFNLAQQTESRKSLTSIIISETLYQQERAKMPMEDLIDKMKSNVRVTPVSGPLRDGTPLAFAIGFTYADPTKAQRVTQDLAAAMRENAAGAGQVDLEIDDAASLPQSPVYPNRWIIVMMGLSAGEGLALALILAFRRRVSRRNA
jgi:capsular polysaccharide biosynthesis protein